MLDFAKARGFSEGDNPARWRGHLALTLPAPSRVHRTTHRAAVPHAELPKVMANLARTDGVAALAVRFAALTAQRATATSHARWRDIDQKAGVWTVPVEHAKTGRALAVPLSQPEPRRRPASPAQQPGVSWRRAGLPISLPTLVRRCGSPVGSGTTHGLRSGQDLGG